MSEQSTSVFTIDSWRKFWRSVMEPPIFYRVFYFPCTHCRTVFTQATNSLGQKHSTMHQAARFTIRQWSMSHQITNQHETICSQTRSTHCPQLQTTTICPHPACGCCETKLRHSKSFRLGSGVLVLVSSPLPQVAVHPSMVRKSSLSACTTNEIKHV